MQQKDGQLNWQNQAQVRGYINHLSFLLPSHLNYYTSKPPQLPPPSQWPPFNAVASPLTRHIKVHHHADQVSRKYIPQHILPFLTIHRSPQPSSPTCSSAPTPHPQHHPHPHHPAFQSSPSPPVHNVSPSKPQRSTSTQDPDSCFPQTTTAPTSTPRSRTFSSFPTAFPAG